MASQASHRLPAVTEVNILQAWILGADNQTAGQLQ